MSTLTSVALISALALAACGEAENGSEDPEETADAAAADTDDTSEDADEEGGNGAAEEDSDEGVVEPSERPTHEAGGAEPRLVITYDGGVSVLDGVSLESVGDFEAEGFLRVNEAGDGRHAFLTEGDSFRLIDAGTWGEPHGDHNDYYTTDPLLSDLTLDGDAPAHVVSHDGIGTLFFDGTGEYHTIDLTELSVEDEQIETTGDYETEGAHHGVAVVAEDGSRFETLEDRSGARFLDTEGEEVDRNEDCPGVHGEAAGPEGIIAVGCEDGVLIWNGETFEKLDTGEEYSRIGNLFPAEGSPVFLGDYNLNEDGGEMTEVALVNSETGEITTTDVGSPYNWRNLQRGPEGEALVLTEDGQLHIIDPETGEHLEHIDVLDEWTEPEEWQEPRPAIRVNGDLVYVTDPDNQEIHLLDLTEGEVITTAEVDFVPNEIIVIDGRPVEGVSDEYDEGDDDAVHDHDHDEDEDHDHDDHDHDEDHDHEHDHDEEDDDHDHDH
ncbi:PQQ-like beta-propeller repeat protein [Nesterenkonia sedimenti]|uniref:PQQ-like beta-propeller repeat protein n=1 Tax=Nesterenkonia sedimenti TaxID=1463632 RepID=UPI001B3B2114|nr:PQQ-like beta-propeller repeat protein [Nesterenkonia sedimenti]